MKLKKRIEQRVEAQLNTNQVQIKISIKICKLEIIKDDYQIINKKEALMIII